MPALQVLAVFAPFTAAAIAVFARRQKLRRREAVKSKGKDRGTILSKRLPNRHKVVKGAIGAAFVERVFKDIKATFAVQDGVRYKGQDWRISSYMELDPNGHISGKHKVEPHIPLLNVCSPLLERCDAIFENWYAHCYGCKFVKAERLHSFVTRYQAKPGYDQLRKHIDGRHLDGSAIIRLPNEEGCASGDLKVWDGKNPIVCQTYKMESGDFCLLDRAVWHQALPVTEGIKWCIVIFYKAHRWKRAALRAKAASPGSRSLQNIV